MSTQVGTTTTGGPSSPPQEQVTSTRHPQRSLTLAQFTSLCNALQTDLRSILQECKKLPDIRNAAEQASHDIKLLQMPSHLAPYDTPTPSPDLPPLNLGDALSKSLFTLFCDCLQAKGQGLLSPALSALQHMLSYTSFVPGILQTLSALRTVAEGSSDEKIQVRLLQILQLSVNHRTLGLAPSVHEVAIPATLGITYKMLASRGTIVRATAYATLRQIIRVVFESAEHVASSPERELVRNAAQLKLTDNEEGRKASHNESQPQVRQTEPSRPLIEGSGNDIDEDDEEVVVYDLDHGPVASQGASVTGTGRNYTRPGAQQSASLKASTRARGVGADADLFALIAELPLPLRSAYLLFRDLIMAARVSATAVSFSFSAMFGLAGGPHGPNTAASAAAGTNSSGLASSAAVNDRQAGGVFGGLVNSLYQVYQGTTTGGAGTTGSASGSFFENALNAAVSGVGLGAAGGTAGNVGGIGVGLGGAGAHFWLSPHTAHLNTALALEVINSILTESSALFMRESAFTSLISTELSAAIIELLGSCASSTSAVSGSLAVFTGCARAIYIVLSQFGTLPEVLPHCELLLTHILRMAQPETSVAQRVVLFELFNLICSDPNLVLFLLNNFDSNPDQSASKILGTLLHSTARLVHADVMALAAIPAYPMPGLGSGSGGGSTSGNPGFMTSRGENSASSGSLPAAMTPAQALAASLGIKGSTHTGLYLLANHLLGAGAGFGELTDAPASSSVSRVASAAAAAATGGVSTRVSGSTASSLSDASAGPSGIGTEPLLLLPPTLWNIHLNRLKPNTSLITLSASALENLVSPAPETPLVVAIDALVGLVRVISSLAAQLSAADGSTLSESSRTSRKDSVDVASPARSSADDEVNPSTSPGAAATASARRANMVVGPDQVGLPSLNTRNRQASPTVDDVTPESHVEVVETEKLQGAEEEVPTTEQLEDIVSDLIELSWGPLLTTLSSVLMHTIDPQMIQHILVAYQSFTNTCGSCGLSQPRNHFLSSLCAFALPSAFTSPQIPATAAITGAAGSLVNAAENPIIEHLLHPEVVEALIIRLDSDLRVGTSGSSSSAQAAAAAINMLLGGSGSNASGASNNLGTLSTTSIILPSLIALLELVTLTPKNIQALKALFNVAHCLGPILGESWTFVLQTFEKLDVVLRVLNTLQKNVPAESYSPRESYLQHGAGGHHQLVHHGPPGASARSSRSLSGTGSSSSGGALISSTGMAGAGTSGYSRQQHDSLMAAIASALPSASEIILMETALNQLFSTSRRLDMNALREMLSALNHLAVQSIAAAVIVDSGIELPTTSSAMGAGGIESLDPQTAATDISRAITGDVDSGTAATTQGSTTHVSTHVSSSVNPYGAPTVTMDSLAGVMDTGSVVTVASASALKPLLRRVRIFPIVRMLEVIELNLTSRPPEAALELWSAAVSIISSLCHCRHAGLRALGAALYGRMLMHAIRLFTSRRLQREQAASYLMRSLGDDGRDLDLEHSLRREISEEEKQPVTTESPTKSQAISQIEDVDAADPSAAVRREPTELELFQPLVDMSQSRFDDVRGYVVELVGVFVERLGSTIKDGWIALFAVLQAIPMGRAGFQHIALTRPSPTPSATRAVVIADDGSVELEATCLSGQQSTPIAQPTPTADDAQRSYLPQATPSSLASRLRIDPSLPAQKSSSLPSGQGSDEKTPSGPRSSRGLFRLSGQFAISEVTGLSLSQSQCFETAASAAAAAAAAATAATALIVSPSTADGKTLGADGDGNGEVFENAHLPTLSAAAAAAAAAATAANAGGGFTSGLAPQPQQVAAGFRMLNLIVYDFVHMIPYSLLPLLIRAVSWYMPSPANSNTSFTAISLLWRLADHIFRLSPAKMLVPRPSDRHVSEIPKPLLRRARLTPNSRGVTSGSGPRASITGGSNSSASVTYGFGLAGTSNAPHVYATAIQHLRNLGSSYRNTSAIPLPSTFFSAVSTLYAAAEAGVAALSSKLSATVAKSDASQDTPTEDDVAAVKLQLQALRMSRATLAELMTIRAEYFDKVFPGSVAYPHVGSTVRPDSSRHESARRAKALVIACTPSTQTSTGSGRSSSATTDPAQLAAGVYVIGSGPAAEALRSLALAEPVISPDELELLNPRAAEERDSDTEASDPQAGESPSVGQSRGLADAGIVLPGITIPTSVGVGGLVLPGVYEPGSAPSPADAENALHMAGDQNNVREIGATMCDRLILDIYAQLTAAATDVRAEVRNSAVKVLFKSVETNCARLQTSTLVVCFHGLLQPLVETLLSDVRNAASVAPSDIALGTDRAGKQIMMVGHHTRDTSSKQWNETCVHALTGLARAVRVFLKAVTTTTLPGYPGVAEWQINPVLSEALIQTWTGFLRLFEIAMDHQSSEVACAAVQVLHEFLLTPSVTQLLANPANRVLWNAVPVALGKIVENLVLRAAMLRHTSLKRQLISGEKDSLSFVPIPGQPRKTNEALRREAMLRVQRAHGGGADDVQTKHANEQNEAQTTAKQVVVCTMFDIVNRILKQCACDQEFDESKLFETLTTDQREVYSALLEATQADFDQACILWLRLAHGFVSLAHGGLTLGAHAEKSKSVTPFSVSDVCAVVAFTTALVRCEPFVPLNRAGALAVFVGNTLLRNFNSETPIQVGCLKSFIAAASTPLPDHLWPLVTTPLIAALEPGIDNLLTGTWSGTRTSGKISMDEARTTVAGLILAGGSAPSLIPPWPFPNPRAGTLAATLPKPTLLHYLAFSPGYVSEVLHTLSELQTSQLREDVAAPAATVAVTLPYTLSVLAKLIPILVIPGALTRLLLTDMATSSNDPSVPAALDATALSFDPDIAPLLLPTLNPLGIKLPSTPQGPAGSKDSANAQQGEFVQAVTGGVASNGKLPEAPNAIQLPLIAHSLTDGFTAFHGICTSIVDYLKKIIPVALPVFLDAAAACGALASDGTSVTPAQSPAGSVAANPSNPSLTNTPEQTVSGSKNQQMTAAILAQPVLSTNFASHFVDGVMVSIPAPPPQQAFSFTRANVDAVFGLLGDIMSYFVAGRSLLELAYPVIPVATRPVKDEAAADSGSGSGVFMYPSFSSSSQPNFSQACVLTGEHVATWETLQLDLLTLLHATVIPMSFAASPHNRARLLRLVAGREPLSPPIHALATMLKPRPAHETDAEKLQARVGRSSPLLGLAGAAALATETSREVMRARYNALAMLCRSEPTSGDSDTSGKAAAPESKDVSPPSANINPVAATPTPDGRTILVLAKLPGPVFALKVSSARLLVRAASAALTAYIETSNELVSASARGDNQPSDLSTDGKTPLSKTIVDLLDLLRNLALDAVVSEALLTHPQQQQQQQNKPSGQLQPMPRLVPGHRQSHLALLYPLLCKCISSSAPGDHEVRTAIANTLVALGLSLGLTTTGTLA